MPRKPKRKGTMPTASARPKSKSEGKMELRLRVDADLHDRIQAAADSDGNPASAFIRVAIVRELKRREKEGER